MKISIGTKLIISFLLFVVLLGALAYYSVFVSKTFLEQSVGKSSVFLAEEMLRIVDKSTYSKIEELQRYSKNALLQNTVVQSNEEFEKIEDREEYINRIDRDWISSDEKNIIRLINELINYGSKHYELSVYKKSPFSILLIPQVRKILKTEGIDIVHARSRVPAWISFFATRNS